MSLAFSPCRREQSQLDTRLPTGEWNTPGGPTEELPTRKRNVEMRASTERTGKERALGRTGQLLGQPKEGPKPPADPKEKAPAVEESKGLTPQLARAMRWVWERLLSSSLDQSPQEVGSLTNGAGRSCPSLHQECIQGLISTGWSNAVCLWSPCLLVSDQRETEGETFSLFPWNPIQPLRCPQHRALKTGDPGAETSRE